MKITTEQLVALQQAQQKKKAAQDKSQTDFQKLLTEKTQQAGSASTAAAPQRAGSSELYAKIQASMTRPTDQTSEQAVMDKMDSVLNRWENYAQLLGSASPNLRQGYQLLESITNDIDRLHDELPDSGEEADRIRPLLDELEILAVTEKVKFNRGDYI